MKKRNPLAVVLLSVITLGIYDLFWLLKTKNALNEKTKQHIPSLLVLVSPWAVVIAGYVILFATANTTTTTYTNNYGQTITSHTGNNSFPLAAFGVIFIGFLLSFVLSGYWTFKYSKAVDEYTNGKMNTSVAFLLLWLVHLIGVALIQDAFNEAGASPAISNGVAPAFSPVAQQPSSPTPGTTPQLPPQDTNPPNDPPQAQ